MYLCFADSLILFGSKLLPLKKASTWTKNFVKGRAPERMLHLVSYEEN
jgi:hypothetical protein